MRLHIPVPPGELIDKITILKVKLLFMRDKKKVASVKRYLKELQTIRKMMLVESALLRTLEKQLLLVNKNQWKIENAIRTHLKKYGPNKAFGRLVASLHKSNDKRASLKRKIDEHLNSDLRDEKQYE